MAGTAERVDREQLQSIIESQRRKLAKRFQIEERPLQGGGVVSVVTEGLDHDLSISSGRLEEYGLTTYWTQRYRPVKAETAQVAEGITIPVYCVDYEEIDDGKLLKERDWLFLVRSKGSQATPQVVCTRDFQEFSSEYARAISFGPQTVPYQVSTTDLLGNPGPELGQVAGGKYEVVGIVVEFPE